MQLFIQKWEDLQNKFFFKFLILKFKLPIRFISHVHPNYKPCSPKSIHVHLICLGTTICFLSLIHYRYDMASNCWQEESHVPKETLTKHWIKYLRNKVLPSTYLNLNAWKLKVMLTNCALTIRLLLLKNLKRTTIHPSIISISIENLAIEIKSTD